jgi:hypothetical protein
MLGLTRTVLASTLRMYALPPRIEALDGAFTGVACPDCSGVLGVRAEGRDGFLVFACRIQHTYDVAELLATKEERLEERLWCGVVALEELARLLADLATQGGDHGESAGARRAYEERAAVTRRHADALRAMINTNGSVDLSQSQTDGRMPHDQR